MKIIVDVQKLWNDIGEMDSADVKFYMSECLAPILAKSTASWPTWAEKKTATRSAKLDGGYTPDFEIFWSHYPKKVGKGLAFEVWKKLVKKEEALDFRCQQALGWQKKLWAKDNNKYVPNPENYLKGRRWEDEPQTITSKERYQDMNGNWREK